MLSVLLRLEGKVSRQREGLSALGVRNVRLEGAKGPENSPRSSKEK